MSNFVPIIIRKHNSVSGLCIGSLCSFIQSQWNGIPIVLLTGRDIMPQETINTLKSIKGRISDIFIIGDIGQITHNVRNDIISILPEIPISTIDGRDECEIVAMVANLIINYSKQSEPQSGDTKSI
jgi:hypothetical protein